jgi:hypothetical protein
MQQGYTQPSPNVVGVTIEYLAFVGAKLDPRGVPDAADYVLDGVLDISAVLT